MKKMEFSVFPKKLHNGTTIFYYTTYDENNRRHQFSTGKKDRTEAIKFCMDRMIKGRLVPKSSLSFSEYAEHFYDYEKSDYIQSRLRRGFSYSHSGADCKNRFIHTQAIPFFGEKSITAITPKDIEDFANRLKDSGLTNTTVNHYMKDLKVIFHEALRRNDIQTDPTRQILPFRNDTREKGIFTVAEIESLFCGENIVQRIWNGNKEAYLMNLLAVKTGMRLGEIQALRVQDIKEDYIFVQHSWEANYGLKSTKTGNERIIPVKSEILSELLSLNGSTEKDAFVFSHTDGKTPTRRAEIYKGFHRALERIGLGREERERRNISFHSWRHTFASILANKNVPEVYIRRLTGHSSMQMLDHYTHIQVERLAAAIE